MVKSVFGECESQNVGNRLERGETRYGVLALNMVKEAYKGMFGA